MARKRMIDPNIWESEDFGWLSLGARLLFIGMISNADDEGKGKASLEFLRANIFRYDTLTNEQIGEWLDQIAHKMSVSIYSIDGKSYYQFDHWDEWQRISHPSPSKIPSPENSGNFRKIPEDSVKAPERSSTTELNITEYKKNITECNVREPEDSGNSLHDQIREYGQENGISESICDQFYEYNSEKNWMFKGGKMKDWKTALLAFNKKKGTLTTHNYEQRTDVDWNDMEKRILVNLDEV